VERILKAPRKEAHEDPKWQMIFDGNTTTPDSCCNTKAKLNLLLRNPDRTSSSLATYEQPPAPFNPFDDKEIMEDISSDSSTDSTTFPVKKAPKKPKQPTKANKKQPVVPSIPNEPIPNDQSTKKEPLPMQQSGTPANT